MRSMSRLGVTLMVVVVLTLNACSNRPKGGEPEASPTPQSSTYAAKMLGALDRGAVEKTRADMHAIATAMMAYGSQTGEEPNAPDFAALALLLSPTFIHLVPARDAWGSAFHFDRTDSAYRLVAPGADGALNTGDDIVLTDGTFTKLPDGFRGL